MAKVTERAGARATRTTAWPRSEYKGGDQSRGTSRGSISPMMWTLLT
jgi:hypothetical protein